MRKRAQTVVAHGKKDGMTMRQTIKTITPHQIFVCQGAGCRKKTLQPRWAGNVPYCSDACRSGK